MYRIPVLSIHDGERKVEISFVIAIPKVFLVFDSKNKNIKYKNTFKKGIVKKKLGKST